MMFPAPLTIPYPAYPRIEATATSGSYTAQTNCAVSLPAGIVSGERLLTFLAVQRSSSVTVTPASGWTAAINAIGSGGNLRRAVVLERVATGTEGSSVTHTFSGSSTWAAVSLRVSEATLREVSTVATTTGAAPDPPNYAWTSGSRDTLVLAACWVDFSNTTHNWTGDPSGYDVVATSRPESGGNAIAAVRVVSRLLSGISSHDPGAFALSTSRAWAAASVFAARHN